MWKKEVGNLEFYIALVISEREEDGGTLLESLEEKQSHREQISNGLANLRRLKL